jgi:SAM-dependent methyltransferase
MVRRASLASIFRRTQSRGAARLMAWTSDAERWRVPALAAERFDLVVMIDVIEHLRGPRDFFAAAARCVRRGGAMLITTPNARSFQHARRDWPYLGRALEHVTYFSRRRHWTAGLVNGLAAERIWTEGLPARLPAYRRPAAPRPLRMTAEPLTTLSNGWRRWKFRDAAAGGYGLELRAILRRG